MDQRVHSVNPEQSRGAQPSNAKRAVGKYGLRNDCVHTKAGEELGPSPDRKPDSDARARAPAVCPAPKDSANHRRQNLRDTHERHQSNRRKCRPAARETKVDIAQRQDHTDRNAPRHNNNATHITRYCRPRCARIQPSGYDNVVGHHRRESQSRHDHHRCRRRKSPQKRENRKPFAALRQRQCHHEQIRVRALRHKIKPNDGDWHDKQAHQQQICGKRPTCGADGAFVAVFNHKHLEHARQTQKRGGGHENQANPAAGLRRPLRLSGCINQIHRRTNAPRNTPNNKHTNGQQCEQFHHRFHGNRNNDAVMAFMGIQISGAKQHRKDG